MEPYVAGQRVIYMATEMATVIGYSPRIPTLVVIADDSMNLHYCTEEALILA
jgi:hypothetical protein